MRVEDLEVFATAAPAGSSQRGHRLRSASGLRGRRHRRYYSDSGLRSRCILWVSGEKHVGKFRPFAEQR